MWVLMEATTIYAWTRGIRIMGTLALAVGICIRGICIRGMLIPTYATVVRWPNPTLAVGIRIRGTIIHHVPILLPGKLYRGQAEHIR
jgi:hypothetical protein